MSIIDAGRNVVTSTVKVGPDADGPMEVSKDGTRLYIPRRSGLSVTDATTGTSIAQLSLPTTPRNNLLNRDGTRLYFTSASGNADDIQVIDTTKNTLAARIHTPFVPGGIALDPSGPRLFVGKTGSKSFAVVSHQRTRPVPERGTAGK